MTSPPIQPPFIPPSTLTPDRSQAFPERRERHEMGGGWAWVGRLLALFVRPTPPEIARIEARRLAIAERRKRHAPIRDLVEANRRERNAILRAGPK